MPIPKTAEIRGASDFRSGKRLTDNPYTAENYADDIASGDTFPRNIRGLWRAWNNGYTRAAATAAGRTSAMKGKPRPSRRTSEELSASCAPPPLNRLDALAADLPPLRRKRKDTPREALAYGLGLETGLEGKTGAPNLYPRSKKPLEYAAWWAGFRRGIAHYARKARTAKERRAPRGGRRVSNAEKLWNDLNESRARVGGRLSDYLKPRGKTGEIDEKGAARYVSDFRALVDDLLRRAHP